MNIAIILAAGKSNRFGTDKNGKKDKLLQSVLNFPVVYYSIQTIHDHPKIDEVYIVASSTNQKKIQKLVKDCHFPKVKKVILGGTDRQASARKGLNEINNAKIILIHNGANPLVTEKEITQLINAAKKHKAAAVGHKVNDTIKEVDEGHLVKTHDRNKLIAMQTPQAFEYELLKKAHRKTQKKFTDDAALIENIGLKVKYVPASKDNFKITTPHDLEKLKAILGDTPSNFLVGLGQDSHEFSASKKGLWLGGIHFKDKQKLEADSDGDVILHALFNAISQAFGEGSLGRFATPLYKEKGITRSKKYLQPLLTKVKKRGYQLHNLGLMIEAKKPKIDPLANKLKKSISQITGLNEKRIGITATSGKSLSAFGRGKGIQCFAIVSLKKDES